jgi:phosphomevalonate kinase
LLVDKFNKKYKSLNENQKDLLKEYINNLSNTNSLNEFVNSEVVKIKKNLKKYVKKVDDDITRIKLEEAINHIDTLVPSKVVKDKNIISLMRYYELIKELQDVTIKKAN